jgi:hypothetical protein
MIYEQVATVEPIRQGDIFKNLPRIDISLKEILVLGSTADSETVEQMTWEEAIQRPEQSEQPKAEQQQDSRLVRAVLPVYPVDAIVITQDCDAARAVILSLCEITALTNMNKAFATMTSPTRWAKELSRQDSENVRFFYCPPDHSMGFSERMAVDFRSILRLPEPHLDDLKTFRVGRLNRVAYEHFREKMAQYFRRCPYDPWYPLNKEEFELYAKEYPAGSVKPFDWQT